MPKQSIPFTEKYIRDLPIPETGDRTNNDRGLKMRVYLTGSKKWSFFKQAPNGIRKTIPIGKYPAISVKQAREIADKRLGDMIREGHEIESNKAGVTFGHYMLSDEYKNWSISTRRSHKSIMANLQAVVPVWFTRKPLKLFTNNDFTKFCNDRKTGKDGLKYVKLNPSISGETVSLDQFVNADTPVILTGKTSGVKFAVTSVADRKSVV